MSPSTRARQRGRIGCQVLSWLLCSASALQAQQPGAQPPPAQEPSAREDASPAPGAPVPGNDLTPPRLLKFVDAEYPSAAKDAGLTADVLLRLRVESDGSVSEAEVIEGAGHGFDEAALAAARQFVFSPATRAGKPIVVRIPFKYSFTLQEQVIAAPTAPTRGNFAGQVRIAGVD